MKRPTQAPTIEAALEYVKALGLRPFAESGPHLSNAENDPFYYLEITCSTGETFQVWTEIDGSVYGEC